MELELELELGLKMLTRICWHSEWGSSLANTQRCERIQVATLGLRSMGFDLQSGESEAEESGTNCSTSGWN